MPAEIRLLAPGEAHLLDHVAPGTFDDPLDAAATRTFLGDPRHHLAVALDGGRVVGFVSAVHVVHPDKPRPELWVNEVGVAPSHRRRGLARALLTRVLALARDLRCTEAWVLTGRGNAPAQRLYASLGGQPEPEDAVMFTFPLEAVPARPDGPGQPWHAFSRAAPALARAGLRLLYQDAPIASAFLATVARDGGPRLHPVFPVVADGELWLFVVRMSPKHGDLCQNGRYALHAQPPPGGGEAFAVRGRAERVADPALKARVVAATDGRQGGHAFETLFRCRLDSALHTVWDRWGTADAWPRYAKWLAADPAA